MRVSPEKPDTTDRATEFSVLHTSGHPHHAPRGFNLMVAVEQPAHAERVCGSLAWMMNCAKPPETVSGAA